MHRETPETLLSPGETPAQGFKAQASHPFSYGSILYSITKIERVNELKLGSTSLTTPGSFLLLVLSISNQGSEPMVFELSDFTAYDNKGRKFTANQSATKLAYQIYGKADISGEALQPGLARESVVAFEVPRDAVGFSLRLLHGYLDVNLGF